MITKGLWARCPRTGLFGQLLYIIEPAAPWAGPDWCLQYINGSILEPDSYGFKYLDKGIWFRNLDIGKHAMLHTFREFPVIDWANLEIFLQRED